jgi:hypothetical protein
MFSQQQHATWFASKAAYTNKGQENQQGLANHDPLLVLGLPAKKPASTPARKGTPANLLAQKTSKQLTVNTEMFKDKGTNPIAAKKARAKEKCMLEQCVKHLELRITRSKAKAMSDSSSNGESMQDDSFDSAETSQKMAVESPSTAVVFIAINDLIEEGGEVLAQGWALDISME